MNKDKKKEAIESLEEIIKLIKKDKLKGALLTFIALLEFENEKHQAKKSTSTKQEAIESLEEIIKLIKKDKLKGVLLTFIALLEFENETHRDTLEVH